jgi:SNF2 family DNA or RNA helicase
MGVPALYIFLNESLDVSISGNEFVTGEQWFQISTWWLKSVSARTTDRKIILSSLDFVSRMQWLREEWSDQGNEIVIEPNVIGMVNSVRSTKIEFDQLLVPRPFIEDGELPIRLARTLTHHQNRNVQLLVQMKNGANFSVPGAGKTMTAIVVWDLLRKGGGVGKLLVICPRSAFEAWNTEFSASLMDPVKVFTFSGDPIDPDADVVITNYEQIENVSKLQYLVAWSERNSINLVVDEAHRVKAGGRSVRWRACQQLSKVSKRVDIMTGTPMPQGIEDLGALYRLAWPALPVRTFTEPVLRAMRRNGAFVRTTKTELKLPPLLIGMVNQPASVLQRQIYDALIDQYKGLFALTGREASLMARRGKAVMALIEAATNPKLLFAPSSSDELLGIKWPPSDISSNKTLLNLAAGYTDHEMPWKYKFVAKAAEKAAMNGLKVLVWSSFVGNLRALSKVLERFNPALVYGGTPLDEREIEISRFRNDPNCTVLLTNPQTLGEGVSLHKECHEAIYLDRTYNAGMYLQSLDRIHRLGLEDGTITRVTILSTEATIDSRIASRLDLKIHRLASFLNDEGLVSNALPNTDELEDFNIVGLEESDFADLFSHLSEGA